MALLFLRCDTLAGGKKQLCRSLFMTSGFFCSSRWSGGRSLVTTEISAAELRQCAPQPLCHSQLMEMIATARVSPRDSNHPPRREKRFANHAGEWKCISCSKWLPAEDFYTKKSTQKPCSRCKDCKKEQCLKYCRTLRGCISRMLANAKSNANVRGQEFSLTREHVCDMLAYQEARCAYSGVPMEVLLPNSHWRVSLERVDNSIGYTRKNCVLIAAEFNSSDYSRLPGVDADAVKGTAQWSAEKVQQVHALRQTNLDLASLHKDIEGAQLPLPRMTRSRGNAPKTSMPPEPGFAYCTKCFEQKPHAEFHRNASVLSGHRSSCKQCKKVLDRAYRSTLRGHLKGILNNAQRRSKLRGQECSIRFSSLVHMLERQQGRCFYSRVPLQYKELHTDWRLSLERLNNEVGYTEDNCVLIAVEFNTPDYSRSVAVTEVFGTSQWWCAKIQHVWGHC
ncbi:unnamed protein product [Durusdinium trenchii]|uniref:Uncharacterized protein n=2 Tax=Durusdinium trenchii TaxID=1381693 RepID=A0ABP0N2G1_9DINO